MLISHKKKFIYTKTAKTAGTSVESYFEKFCMPEGAWEFSGEREEYVSQEGIIGYRGNNPRGKEWRNHMSAIDIRNKIDSSIWDGYFKFCVVRDPFDKLISGFHYFDKQRKNQTITKKITNQIKSILGRTPSMDRIEGKNSIERFRDWIRKGGSVIDRDKYMINGTVCIDYFIRYEDLENGVMHVCDQLDIPFEPDRIPRMKGGLREKISSRDYYDEETIQIVGKLYEFELEYFGYGAPK